MTQPMFPEPPSEAAPGVPDVLAYFFPKRGKRVKPASKVSARTRRREIEGYQRAYPGATRQQAARRTAAMRRRGYVPTSVSAGKATREQRQEAQRYRDRSERSQPAQRVVRDYDPVYVMQVIRNKIGETFQAEAQKEYDRMVANAGPGSPVQPGQPVTSYWEFNEQAVIWNMQHATRQERVWAVEVAGGWDLRHLASQANRAGILSVWFYHGDTVQNGI
jgi:hypothetical protein